MSLDTATNTQTPGGKGSVDSYTPFALPEDRTIEGRLVNVGKKFYQTAVGFNQQGRAPYGTLRYQLK